MNQRVLFLLSVIICFQTCGYSQFNLSGHIVDNDTNEPIETANVYLSNTTVGTTSDKEGDFYLENIPPGKYELVVSVIGFKLQKQVIRMEGAGTLDYQFRLRRQVISLPGVTVTAQDQEERRKDLKDFNLAFLGNSKNAHKTKILNDYVLEFTHNDNILRAWASTPLIIENEGLGYRIRYSLEHFELDRFQVKYSGESQFDELEPSNSKQAQDWAHRREIAYRGSLRHFFTVICTRYQLNKESMILKREKKLNGVYFIEGLLGVLRKPLRNDYLLQAGYQVSLSKKMGAEDNVYAGNTVNTNEFLNPTDSENEMTMKFRNYLRIVYLDEFEDRDFLQEFGILHQPGPQISWISLLRDSIIIDTQGRYHEPAFMLEKNGYMAWERVADMVPADYEP